MSGIDTFLDAKGRIVKLPSKREARKEVLGYLAGKFSPGRDYTEKEVNAVIDEWHTFGDYFLLRRELIEKGLLCRTANGSRYWKDEETEGPAY